jgi:hypothetical protein
MKLETPLYTSTNKAGDTFTGRVTQDVKLNNQVVIPVGASLQGEVTRVTEPRRIKGRPTLQLRPEYVTMPNGQKYRMYAAVVDTNKAGGTSVNSEGQITGPTRTRRDNIELGAGTGAGAIIGGLAAGAKGSLIGAGIGAGGAIAHWFTKRNTAHLPAGTEIIFELSHPMTMTSN